MSKRDVDRLLSCLKNARNILQDGGYLYVKEIDKLLSEFDSVPPHEKPPPGREGG
jgi:hypothetical protein